jgi:hypothetical protein
MKATFGNLSTPRFLVRLTCLPAGRLANHFPWAESTAVSRIEGTCFRRLPRPRGFCGHEAFDWTNLALHLPINSSDL